MIRKWTPKHEREAHVVAEAAEEQLDFICNVCDAAFATSQRLASHKARAHAVHSTPRRLAWGSQCPVCLKEYWHRDRVVHHLSKGRCSTMARLHLPQMSSQVERETAATWRKCGQRPSSGFGLQDREIVQALGPIPLWAIGSGAAGDG